MVNAIEGFEESLLGLWNFNDGAGSILMILVIMVMMELSYGAEWR